MVGICCNPCASFLYQFSSMKLESRCWGEARIFSLEALEGLPWNDFFANSRVKRLQDSLKDKSTFFLEKCYLTSI